MTQQEQQIRQAFPGQTDGRDLVQDERIASHPGQVKGMDAWYVLNDSGVRQYFVKKDSWPAYLAYDPTEWHQLNALRSKAKPVLEVVRDLLAHGLRLDECRPQGQAICDALQARAKRGAKAREAADALLGLVRHELFDSLEHLMPKEMKDELDDVAVCQYAWYFSRVIGFDVDALCDEPGRLWVFGPLPRFEGYFGHQALSCTILSSLDEASPQAVVMTLGQTNYCRERLNLMKAIDCINTLGLGFTPYADAGANALAGDAPEGCVTTLYDLKGDRLVDVFEDPEPSESALPLVTPRQMGLLGTDVGTWMQPPHKDTYLRLIPEAKETGSPYRLFRELGDLSPEVSLLGGYVYTKGDAHDSQTCHDYYLVDGSSARSHFGLEDVATEDTDWSSTTFFSVMRLEPGRPYDAIFVRICDAYFKVGVHAATKRLEPWRDVMPLYLKLTEGTREQALHAADVFEKLLACVL